MKLVRALAIAAIVSSPGFAGVITGQVRSPGQGGRTLFGAIQVYVPGTSCVSMTDQAGNFSLDLNRCPFNGARALTVIANDTQNSGGEGRATTPMITMNSSINLPINLVVITPHVSSVSPATYVIGSGADIVVTGDTFMASRGFPYEVRIGGYLVGGKGAPGNPLNVRQSDTRMVIPAQNLKYIPAGQYSVWLAVNDVGAPSSPLITFQKPAPPPPPAATPPHTQTPSPAPGTGSTPSRGRGRRGECRGGWVQCGAHG